MPYLFRTPEHFVMVDSRPKQGVYYQYFTKDGYYKPTLVHAVATDQFTATLDANYNLHVITEGSRDQILYVNFEKGMADKKVVLEDSSHQYDFQHLSIHPFNESLYLFYSIRHPNGISRSFMYQPLNPTQIDITTLIKTLPQNTVIKTFNVQNNIYIVYTDYAEDYQLKLMILSPTGNTETLLHTSALPIIDFNFCISAGTLHLTYLKDAYGKHQCGYMNTQHQNDVTLAIGQQTEAPCIFQYCGQLWLTYPSQNRLEMMLSVNDGRTFSSGVTSSSTALFHPYRFYNLKDSTLQTTSLLATLSPALRLGVIEAIDVAGMHPDLHPASELELLLEGMRLNPQASFISAAPPPPPMMPVEVTSLAQDLAAATLVPDQPASPLDLKSAARAFMADVNLFDATPKS